jgi:hypothetical protein
MVMWRGGASGGGGKSSADGLRGGGGRVSLGGLVGDEEEEDEELPPALPLLPLMMIVGRQRSSSFEGRSLRGSQMTARSPVYQNRCHGLPKPSFSALQFRPLLMIGDAIPSQGVALVDE